jgi:DNA-binding transcriptional regulator YhcF (GntR family)
MFAQPSRKQDVIHTKRGIGYFVSENEEKVLEINVKVLKRPPFLIVFKTMALRCNFFEEVKAHLTPTLKNRMMKKNKK